MRTTYLEQLTPQEIRPARTPDPRVTITRVELPAPEFCRFLYTAVGGDWYWTDRLPWSRTAWVEYLSRPMVETWVAWSRGAPAGYVELAGSSTVDVSEVEIAYFGLLPGFLGQGLGGHLLTEALRLAWSMAGRWPRTPPVRRVWVHTCTLDGPAALANYQARGLIPFRVEDAETEVSGSPPGSWPGP
ncbi:GNAT family N-acetyltransferase [Actinophytocola sp.]|uniref:GNAT family N-acetyltransferase n=1 Tax=Actinophytocola sp. TaxID=1872138 RepID=UPI002D805CC3|nr:GNAT family N-acetyltransferase [Actinophytocola sp.]HET9140672.1 GNAT family N-acetyltransferase [Actinophytocola sp.]